MYIKNIDSSPPLSNLYECNKKTADYLIVHEIPLLSKKDGVFYFSKTDKLQAVISKIPWYLKILNI